MKTITSNGFATLSPQMVAILKALESAYEVWINAVGAADMAFPALMRAEDLDKLDYFRNFLISVCVHVKLIRHVTKHIQKESPTHKIPREDHGDATYLLPSAACYNIYLYLSDQAIESTQYFSTVAKCFRNENQYTGLSRLRGFTMREIVCVGREEDVKRHIVSFKEKVVDFAAALGLTLKMEVATDPFFNVEGERSLAMRLFPTKEEFIYGEGLSIGSVNFHRNFFGERLNIKIDGEYAFTGCVAFGLERWLHALHEVHEDNSDAILSKLKTWTRNNT